MPTDKYSATWVSHSSIADFLQCPRAYYLKNVYKDPKTNHKMQIMSPPLALGAAVHEVLESLSVLPTEDRFKESLIAKLDKVWQKFSGDKGGFIDKDIEENYKNRAIAMLKIVMENPGPLKNFAVKIKEDLPHFWLSEQDNIILCGKIDWLEYLKDSDAVNIIDFKTGKNEENLDSLQLPIYHLLVHHCQHRKVAGASYWYLQTNEIKPKQLPDLQEAFEQVHGIAKKIKLMKQLNRFVCPNGEKGCRSCQPMVKIINGEGKFIGVNNFNQDVYILPNVADSLEEQSEVL